MNGQIESTDSLWEEGKIGLSVVGAIAIFVLGWFIPSVGVLLGLALIAALAVAVVVLALSLLIAGSEAVFVRSRTVRAPRAVEVKRRPIGT
jgi:hypothetical protein